VQTLAMWDLSADTFRRWHPHCDGPVQSFAYSPDGKWLVVGGRAGISLPYELANWDYDSEFLGGEAVACAPVRRDGGQLMAVGSNVMRLYDMVHHEDIWGVEWGDPDDGFVRTVAFSPDGKLIGWATYAAMVEVWNADRRSRIVQMSFDEHTPAVGFTADGTALALAVGRVGIVYSPRRKKTLGAFQGHTKPINGMTMHPNEAKVLTASADGTARLWALPDAELKCWDWKTGPLSAAAIAPDGLTAAVGSAKGEVVLWDLDG
jgi:WD40 repeat protein